MPGELCASLCHMRDRHRRTTNGDGGDKNGGEKLAKQDGRLKGRQHKISTEAMIQVRHSAEKAKYQIWLLIMARWVERCVKARVEHL